MKVFSQKKLEDLPWNWKTTPLLLLAWGVALVLECLVLIRVDLYRRRWFKPHHAPIPLISVGNLSAGGTGKTPVVLWLIEFLLKHQLQPSVLAQGYQNQTQSTLQRHRTSEAVPLLSACFGDEPMLVAQRFPSVAVYSGKNRIQSAALATQWDQPAIGILDDAYQYLRLHRDLNLLLIDAETGLGKANLLPVGHLREPQEHWVRADAILLTKCNLGFSDRWIHTLKSKLKVDKPIFRSDYQPQQWFNLDHSQHWALDELEGTTAFVSCGIAHPNSLTRTLRQLNLQVVDTLFLSDHAGYTPSTVHSMRLAFEKSGAEVWVTTEKDAVKLRECGLQLPEIRVLHMQAVPEPSFEAFMIDFLRQIKLK